MFPYKAQCKNNATLDEQARLVLDKFEYCCIIRIWEVTQLLTIIAISEKSKTVGNTAHQVRQLFLG